MNFQEAISDSRIELTMEEYEKLNMLEGTGSEKPGLDGRLDRLVGPGRFIDPEKRKILELIILFWIIFSFYYFRKMIRFKGG